ncbi:MAG: hypothetical protein AAGE52_11355 [Myxococcota bacterium]
MNRHSVDALRHKLATERVVLSPGAKDFPGGNEPMQYMIRIVDDADSNIFEGLQAMTDQNVAIPNDWRDDLEDQELLRFSREALNARFDLRVEGWVCRLA